MRGVVLVVASFLAFGVVVDGLRAEPGSRRSGRIIFSCGESGADRPAQMAVMDADGKNRRDLPIDHAFYSTLSRDGRFVMYSQFQAGGGVGIWVMTVDGRPRYRQLVRHSCAAGWSPSGRFIVFVRPDCISPATRSSIWILDTKTKRQRLLIRNGLDSDWSPD
jgi:hypothetical protein